MFEQLNSRDEIAALIPENGVGVELGVAEGKFSEKLLRKSKLSVLYSIDAWAGDRGHDDAQYQKACSLLAPYGQRSKIIRSSFSDALHHFPPEHFDFIYIDGYAHTGQDEGLTLVEWFPKLKRGGIFSGDDYSEKWPKNVAIIDRFAKDNGLKLNVIKDWNGHHSWLIFK